MLLFDIFRFSFQRFFAYPVEILAEIVRTCIELFFLIYFWSLVIQHTNTPITLSSLISYFLISSGIKEIVMAQYGDFGGLLGKLIRQGEISNYLLKPVSPIGVLYATAVGRTGLTWIFSCIMIVFGIAIHPPTTFLAGVFFLFFFIIAWVICFCYNLIEGTIFFYLPDARGIRGSAGHIIGIFSGMLIPLYLFPTWLYQIIRLTPFPYMVYFPTHLLSLNNYSADIISSLGIGVMWCIILGAASFTFWKKSMKLYESIGI